MGDTPCYRCRNKYPEKGGCSACGGTGQARHGMPESQPPKVQRVPRCIARAPDLPLNCGRVAGHDGYHEVPILDSAVTVMWRPE